jgi:hypothetical protein
MSDDNILILTGVLSDLLERFKGCLEQSALEPDDKRMTLIKDTLRPKLAAVIPWIIDDLNKVHEINYATKHGLSVNPHNKGPDLFKDKEDVTSLLAPSSSSSSPIRIEHKHSTLRPATRSSKTDGTTKKLDYYVCNFDFALPLSGHTDLDERLIKLRESINEKISYDGDAVLEVTNRNHTLVCEYRLSRDCILEYLEQYLNIHPNASVANLGGAICNVCGQVHRLNTLMNISKTMTSENKSTLIAAFFKQNISSQCKK